jgi:uncharacterized UPF0160 family protein
MRESEDLKLHHAGYFTPFNEGGIRITEYGAKLDSSGIIFKYFVRHSGNKRIQLENERSDKYLDILCSYNAKEYFITAINKNAIDSRDFEIELDGIIKNVSSVTIKTKNGLGSEGVDTFENIDNIKFKDNTITVHLNNAEIICIKAVKGN